MDNVSETEVATILFKKRKNRERWIEHMRTTYPNDDARVYMMFEIATEFLFQNNIGTVMEQVRKNEIGWNHQNFETIAGDFKEQDDFLENPPQVEEGVLECKRCHSKRTFSFSKQTRRSDESATVFVRCSQCDYMFKI
jgi:DNA-directed RNA polymerase subunit M/transcription elongation factor TFIIS